MKPRRSQRSTGPTEQDQLISDVESPLTFRAFFHIQIVEITRNLDHLDRLYKLEFTT